MNDTKSSKVEQIHKLATTSKALAAQVQTSRAHIGFDIRKILKYDKYLYGFE